MYEYVLIPIKNRYLITEFWVLHLFQKKLISSTFDCIMISVFKCQRKADVEDRNEDF
jgi:hypothetical protein